MPTKYSNGFLTLNQVRETALKLWEVADQRFEEPEHAIPSAIRFIKKCQQAIEAEEI